MIPSHETENNQSIRERVIKAREIQSERYKEMNGIFCNAQMSSRQIRDFVQLDKEGSSRLKDADKAINQPKLPPRAMIGISFNL